MYIWTHAKHVWIDGAAATAREAQLDTKKLYPSPCPHHDSAPSRPHPLICTGAEPIHPVHCPRQLPAWPWPPETRSFFCHFGGGFLVCCGAYNDGKWLGEWGGSQWLHFWIHTSTLSQINCQCRMTARLWLQAASLSPLPPESAWVTEFSEKGPTLTVSSGFLTGESCFSRLSETCQKEDSSRGENILQATAHRDLKSKLWKMRANRVSSRTTSIFFMDIYYDECYYCDDQSRILAKLGHWLEITVAAAELDFFVFFCVWSSVQPHSLPSNYVRNGHRWCAVIRKPGSTWLKHSRNGP